MNNNESGEMTGNEPIDLGEGEKPQLEAVVAEDVDKVVKYNKDALKIFARKKFGFELDLSQHISIIKGDLVKRCQIKLGQILADPLTDEETRGRIEKIIPLYVRHPNNGRVFAASPALLARMDMIPCNKQGVALRQGHYHIPQPKPSFRKNSKNETERFAAGLENEIS